MTQLAVKVLTETAVTTYIKLRVRDSKEIKEQTYKLNTRGWYPISVLRLDFAISGFLRNVC